jgi:hypothetical protein
MSETFFNKPPENPDKDTFYTMGGLDNFANPPPENPDKDTNYTMGGLDTLPKASPVDLSNFIGSAAQLAQLYPGSQNRPQYTPGLTDLRFTRSFQGVSPSGSAYTPSGAGTAPGPDPNKIVYQQPLPEYGSGNLDAALMGGLLGMDWSGAYDDYLKKLEAQTQDVNISNVFTPTNTFTPTVDTDIDVSPTISNVNTVSQTQTQTQNQQQSQGGGLDSFQDQTDTDFDTSDFSDSFMDYIRNLPRSTLQQILEQVTGTTSVSPSVSVRTSTVPTSVTPYTSVVGVTTVTDSFPIYDPKISDEAVGGGLPDFFTEPTSVAPSPPPSPPPPPDTQTEADRQAAAAAEAQRQAVAAEAERKRVADEQARVAAEQARLQAEAEQARKLAEQQRIAEEQRLAAEEAKRQEEQRRIAEEQARQAEAAREAERQRQLAAEAAQRQAAAQAEAERRAAAQAEADRQAAAAEAERQRIADIQTKTAPVVNQATTKFQSDIANAIKQRDNIKNALDEAKRVVGMHKVDRFKRQSAPPIPQTVIDDLQARYTSLDNALKNYNVNEILKNPDYAREQALQSGSNALQALTDPSKPPSPDAVNRVLSKVVDSGLTNVVAQNISEEGAKAILQAVGGDAAVEAFGSMAGDFAGPVGAALVSLARGGSAGTAAAEAAKAYVVATLAAMPGVGQAIAAAIVLDSFLSDALGYKSPINDAVAGAAKSVDKAISWTGKRAIGGDPIGAIGRAISNPVRSISRAFGFQEGGLVDLPGDSMYNDNSQGVLPDIEGYARGGIIPLPGGGKIAKGPGGGLDDLIPTTIDGRRAAALSDGEFVIPADVVSMMGDGSTNAGSKRLYDLVKQVRQHKTGTTRQAGPLQVGKILERTMR